MAEELLIGLQSTMDNLATAISNQGVGTLIDSYDGDAQKFKEWITQIEKYSLMNNLDDSKQIKITFMTSRGAVSDFVFRWQREVAADRNNWETLKNDLTARFSSITDSNHAHALLRQIKQKSNEPVTLYGERLYNLATEAYSNINVQDEGSRIIIQRQLIDYFIDGLNNDGIKFKIMRESPRTLEEAIRTAMGEQNLRKRFALRNSKSNSETPMEVDHARKPRCRHCNRTNHRSEDCRVKQINEIEKHNSNGYRTINSQINNNPRRCYYCGSYEHIRRNCEGFHRYLQRNQGFNTQRNTDRFNNQHLN